MQSRWPALSEPPADPGAAPQARPRKQAPGGVGLSGRVLVPPAFPRSGGELSFRKFRACAAAGVGPAVIAPAAVEQEVKAVDEKHLFVLPCLCVDHLVQVETSLCGACFSASTGSNGCVSEISRAARRTGRPARRVATFAVWSVQWRARTMGLQARDAWDSGPSSRRGTGRRARTRKTSGHR